MMGCGYKSAGRICDDGWLSELTYSEMGPPGQRQGTGERCPECNAPCHVCKGRGTVNPLTAPHDFFCVGVADCPACDGTGDAP